jgi:hypothetical protein
LLQSATVFILHPLPGETSYGKLQVPESKSDKLVKGPKFLFSDNMFSCKTEAGLSEKKPERISSHRSATNPAKNNFLAIIHRRGAKIAKLPVADPI